MAPLINGKYSMQNLMGTRFIDVPGAAPHIQGRDAKLQLWDMDWQPDRYFDIVNKGKSGNAFTVQPLHANYVWEMYHRETQSGTPLILYDFHGANSQLFKFVYAGSPLTYYIINVHSNRVLDAGKDLINTNGSAITQQNIYQSGYKGDNNQKWVLYRAGTTFHKPPKNQNFYIRCAYSNKYWDLPGIGGETNQNGKPINIWDLDDEGDRKFRLFLLEKTIG